MNTLPATRPGDRRALLRDATTDERRRVVLETVDQVYARRREVLAIRPTGVYAEVLALSAQLFGTTTDWYPPTPRKSEPVKIPIILPARAEVR